nr:hypothetical protein [uncultured Blautia sp.]
MRQKQDLKDNLREKINKGFSVLTVIISVAFVGILALLVLYMALSNFNMKVSDRKGKDSFYTAERALEEIRTGLQEDVGDSMSRAYIKVLEDYNKESDSFDTVLDELRQEAFEKEFLQDIKKCLRKADTEWNDTYNQGIYDLEHIRNYVDLRDSSDFDEKKESLIVTNPSDRNPVLKIEGEEGILLKNLKVIYVDPQGLASVIETDIRLEVPRIQFPTPSTLPDLMNMIVVADHGIICEGETGKANTITGSIYAGLLKDTDQPSGGNDRTGILVKSKGSLDITSGDKVVSAGEIYVENSAAFTSEAGVNLWAQGVRLASAEVKLLGTTYLSDDLTVEKGSGSKVTVSGEYYGYGSPESARAENSRNWNNGEGLYKDWADSALSSAIVINGKNTTMDLSGIRKMMVAGKNYISGTGVKSTIQNNASDIMTGESLTVKGTQLAYLLPAELLNLQNSSVAAVNPMTYTDYLNSGLEEGSAMVNMDTPEELWGGNSLSQIGVDPDNPVQKVFYNDNSVSDGGYVYFYLNFTDDSKAADFMNQYYFSNDTVRQNMNKYLSFYFGPEAGITVNDSQNYLRCVTGGNVLSYDGDSASGSLENATDSEADQKLLQEQTNYQNSWYALNRKMITSVDLLKTEVKDEDGQAHDETDSTRSVFDNLVNEKGMVQYLQQNSSGDLKYQFTSSTEDGGLTAIMYHNGSSSTYTDETGRTVTVNGKNSTLVIDRDLAARLRLVICTGDVEIERDVEFRGIIMAKGTITLKPGATLESSPLEAAKVFQSAVGNGQDISPKQFFWEGDKYVLGNTSSTEEDKDSGLISDSYNLADYVSYENWRKE